MSKVEISIQSALERKKLLKKKIDEATNSQELNKVSFLGWAADSDKTILGKDREEAIKIIQASFQSRRALIKNYQTLSAAINLANATNDISYVDPKTDETITMKAADAIRRHQEIQYEIRFLKAIKIQATAVCTKITSHNEQVKDPDSMSDYVSKILTTFPNPTPDDKERVEQKYLEDNIWKLIDPSNIVETIDSLIYEVELFEANIHTALIESNLTNKIEIEFED